MTKKKVRQTGFEDIDSIVEAEVTEADDQADQDSDYTDYVTAADQGGFKLEDVEAESIETADFGGFKLEDLLVSEDEEAGIETKPIVTSIAVRKPDKQWFFRVDPDPAYQAKLRVLLYQEDTYLLAPGLWRHPDLARDTKLRHFVYCKTSHGVFFLWPVPVPTDADNIQCWKTAQDAALQAQRRWIRMAWDSDRRDYSLVTPVDSLPEPDFDRDMSLEQLLNLGFRDRYITSLEHPVVKKLRGAV